MDRSLQLKPCFRYEVAPSEGVFLLSERGDHLLRGRIYPLVIPLLDGTRTDEAVADALSDRLTPAEVFFAIDRLESEGYVSDAVAPVAAARAAFWNLCDVSPASAEERLAAARVEVISLGGDAPDAVVQALGSAGVRVETGGAILLVLTNDYLRNDVAELDRAALAEGRCRYYMKPVGVELWLGPLLVPGRTGCLACLTHRLAGHRRASRYLQSKRLATEPLSCSRAAWPPAALGAAGLAASEIARWIGAACAGPPEGTLATLDASSLVKQDHALVRRPQCSVCGDPSLVRENQLQPLHLRPEPKRFVTDGGHRSVSPHHTWERLRHHISPITGIAGSLRPSTKDPSGSGLTPAYAAEYAVSTLREPPRFQTRAGRAAGKGKSEVQARTSALCECIERYSAIFQGDEARVSATLGELGPLAVHPNACMLFSEAQLAGRPALGEATSRNLWVPERFDESRAIEWSPVWSLTAEARRYVPTSLCYFGYFQSEHAPFARADSNGCAAGGSVEEAILQGFMELVERDSVAVWWYNRLRRPGVDLESFGDPYFRDVTQHYASLGRDLSVLDITSDLSIPAFAAVSRRRDQQPEDILLGFGAHFDERIALLRAVTEVSQMLPSVTPRSPEGASSVGLDPTTLAFWRTATVAEEPSLNPDEARPKRLASPVLDRDEGDLLADVRRCVALAAEKGLETLVLDMTRPDTGLSVVKVIVPGLRHFWPRFAQGRLYEAPVAMGERAASLSESELNPRVFPF